MRLFFIFAVKGRQKVSKCDNELIPNTAWYKTQIISSNYMHPPGQRHPTKVVECVVKVTGQPVSLFPSFPTAPQTADATGTHSSRQPGRTCFTFLSLKERTTSLVFFLIITVAWKCSLTPWTTREVLYSFLKNNKK